MVFRRIQKKSTKALLFMFAVAWVTETSNAGSCSSGKRNCDYHFQSFRLLCDGTNIARIPAPDKIQSPAPPETSKILWANHSCIEQIYPGDLLPYTHLKEINLDGNRIENVENNAFKYCTTLQKILLSNNKINSIEQHAFAGLQNLSVVNLNGNFITEITQFAFNDLGSVKELRLANNRISVIHPDAFKSLKSVEILDLSGNQLTDLPWRGAFKFPKLRTLILKDNNLSSFDGSDLRYYPNLSELDLRRNNINFINNTKKFRKRNFMYVLLANNQLTHPDPDLFRTSCHGKSLTRLAPEHRDFVNGNPWSCDCVYDYWYFLTRGIISPAWKSALDIQCQSGNDTGKMLSTLTPPIICPKKQPTPENPATTVIQPLLPPKNTTSTSFDTVSPPENVHKTSEKEIRRPKNVIPHPHKRIAPPETTKQPTTEQVTQKVQESPPVALGDEEPLKTSVDPTTVAVIVTGVLFLALVAIVLYVLMRYRKTKVCGNKETPCAEIRETTAAVTANNNLPLLADPLSETDPKLVVPPLPNNEIQHQVITKDLNGVHYHSAEARNPRTQRHRSDSAYHSVGDGQITYCEDDGETPLKLPIQVQTGGDADIPGTTTDVNLQIEAQELSTTDV